MTAAVTPAAPAATTTPYELPNDIPDDDATLLHNVLTAMQALDACRSYKVHVTTVGYLIRGALRADTFEIDGEDLHFIASVSPLRVERTLVARAAGRNEILVKVLNGRQRVMLADAATFIAVKKRRLALLQAPA